VSKEENRKEAAIVHTKPLVGALSGRGDGGEKKGGGAGEDGKSCGRGVMDEMVGNQTVFDRSWERGIGEKAVLERVFVKRETHACA